MRQGTCRRSREGRRRSRRTRSPRWRRSPRRRSRMTWMPRMAWKAIRTLGKRKERSEGTTAYRNLAGNQYFAHRGQMPWDTCVSPGSPSAIVAPHHAHSARIGADPITGPPAAQSPFCHGPSLRLAVGGLLCYPERHLMMIARTPSPPIRVRPKEPGMSSSTAGAPRCRALGRTPTTRLLPSPPPQRSTTGWA